MVDPWFEPTKFASLYGAIAGSAAGMLGGLIGGLGGYLAPRGRGRVLVMGMVWLLLLCGLSQLAFGLAACIRGQPYAIYYFPLLCGGICTVVGFVMLRLFRMRYREAELRRVSAEGLRFG